MKRHQNHMMGIWWEWLGLSVSVFVPLLLLWTARENETPSIIFKFRFTSLVLVRHYLRLQDGCFVCCETFDCIRRWEVGETL